MGRVGGRDEVRAGLTAPLSVVIMSEQGSQLNQESVLRISRVHSSTESVLRVSRVHSSTGFQDVRPNQ